jgi:hypothetical protein
MKKITVIAFMLLMFSGVSFAGIRDDLAREVLKFTEIRAMADQVVAQVLQMQASQLKKIDIPAGRKADEAALNERISKLLNGALGWEKLEGEYEKFLVETYTEDELKAIVNFISSDAGRSIIKKEPIIMGKLMVMMQGRIQTVLPEIQKMTRDFAESVKRIK